MDNARTHRRIGGWLLGRAAIGVEVKIESDSPSRWIGLNGFDLAIGHEWWGRMRVGDN